MKPTLRRYVRHAELYGVAELFETAADDGLSPLDRGHLALHLRRVDPDWRLTPAQRSAFLDALVLAGVPDKRIREMCSVSQPTAREAHSKAARSENPEDSGIRVPPDSQALRTAPRASEPLAV